MDHMKGVNTFRNPEKQPFLPPKSPFPAISTPAFGDYGLSGSNEAARLREEQRQHQRTSSENFPIVDPLPWLDELLDESETPVTRGAHRRCSSDSIAYLNGSRRIHSSIGNLTREECGQMTIMSTPLWGSHEFDPCKDARHYFAEEYSSGRLKDTAWAPGLNMGRYSKGQNAAKGKEIHPRSSVVTSNENEAFASSAGKKLEQKEPLEDLKSASEKKDVSQAKHLQSETDSKRVKQQFAQRSRVRKLQYIAELEKSVQALQAEGLKVSAELHFVDQQNFILTLENKFLKERLDSLLHEQLIKCVQQDVLEREIARLQLLLHQQQQQLPSLPPSSPGRIGSIMDLNSQFANISLKH